MLLLPIVLIIWTIGWAFFWTGSQRTDQKPKRECNIEITVQLPQQEQEITQ